MNPTIAEICDSIRRVFQKMLAKKPEDRYESMAEVIQALEQTLASEPALPPAVDPVPARRVRSAIDEIVEEYDSLHSPVADEDQAPRPARSAPASRSKKTTSPKRQSVRLTGSSDMTLPWGDKPLAWYRRLQAKHWLLAAASLIVLIGITVAVSRSFRSSIEAAPVDDEAQTAVIETPAEVEPDESSQLATPPVRLPSIQSERTIGL